MRLILSILLLYLGIGSMIGELYNIKLPSASLYFSLSKDSSTTSIPCIYLLGWLASISTVVCALILFYRLCKPPRRHPAAIRREQHFFSIKRGVWSLRIIVFLACLTSLDFLIVGNKALYLYQDGKHYFPAFERRVYKGSNFGQTGELYDAPANYRLLKRAFRTQENTWIIMPIIPYDSTNDAQPPLFTPLKKRYTTYTKKSLHPYTGLATRLYKQNIESESPKLHIRYRLRKGVKLGPVDGWNINGERVYHAEYINGKRGGFKKSERFYGKGTTSNFLSQTSEDLYTVEYHPTAPSFRHLLGTDSNGNDVLAYLFGGLKVNIQAVLLYIPLTYCIGVTIGLLIGYFGGLLDVVAQRFIESLEAIPFLFVIIIISTIVPIQYKGLVMIAFILVLFGWMGLTYLIRTATYREKARDYVASAKVVGASTTRILLCHILPNILSTIATLIPFSIAGVITAITSLDYLGFGLPPRYASWGKLLNDGLVNLSSPWLVSTAFVAIVGTLTLITFIGEAVREACDPRTFTIYR